MTQVFAILGFLSTLLAAVFVIGLGLAAWVAANSRAGQLTIGDEPPKRPRLDHECNVMGDARTPAAMDRRMEALWHAELDLAAAYRRYEQGRAA